ncbi:unnamed protein product [Brassica napus]|uniref:(rape) hypothetical protein n=1 Tax=Brassica napus TaxID=3708 RepID=A0A816K8W1_BRANA|nr:unnamed protein product [Brassica napus]
MILRLWRNYNKESGNTIEIVVVDKEGTRIHASVADDFPSAVPEKYFADFSDILGGNLDHSCLVDVVGQIVNFGSLENKIIKGKDNMRLLVELRDPKFCSVKECKGAYSISSGYNSTHILLNPTLDFIEEFKASLPDDSLALTNNDSSQWSVGTATSICARFFVLNERLTIGETIDSYVIDQHLAMAFKKDLKRKSPMTDDYGTSLEEAFKNGMEGTTAHYQAILFMYKQLHDALIKKHAEELEVARVQGKLELFDELFNMSALSEEKEKIESELVLAEAKAADVKVPYIDW